MKHLHRFLCKEIDNASLVFFRFFGALLLSVELLNHFFSGDFKEYTEPTMHFHYYGFGWIEAWPELGMYIHFIITILAGVFVAVGLYYRLASIIFFLGYTSIFFMEQAEYVNHSYLYCIIATLFALLPLHTNYSFDVRRGVVVRKDTLPAWMNYIFVLQMGIVYFYAGIAKIHPEWWEAKALTIWFNAKAHYWLIGPLLAKPITPFLFSKLGLFFDLLIAPALLWKRTRVIAFVAALSFHLTNVFVFGLATFPWFSIIITTLFFPPSWPRHFVLTRWFFKEQYQEKEFSLSDSKKWLLPVLGVYFLIQIIIPFRHFLYKGQVNWTEEGHRFAWHMMLRNKDGLATFRVVYPDGKSEVVNPKDYITNHQFRKMMGTPDMLLQFAHFLVEKIEKESGVTPEVYCVSGVSLNGNSRLPIVAPTTNLAKEERKLGGYDWILLHQYE